MFGNSIGLGLLSQAYDLNVDECIKLVQFIPPTFGPFTLCKPYDLKNIDLLAKVRTFEFVDNPDQNIAYKICYATMLMWRPDFNPNNIWNSYEQLWSHGERQKAFERLYPIVRTCFIADLSVDKAQAVHYCAKKHPFIKEVKGLTKAIVEEVLARHGVSVHPDPLPVTVNGSMQKAVSADGDTVPQITSSGKAALWEKALRKELSDFTYGDKVHVKKDIGVFERQLTDFIDTSIKKITRTHFINTPKGYL